MQLNCSSILVATGDFVGDWQSTDSACLSLQDEREAEYWDIFEDMTAEWDKTLADPSKKQWTKVPRVSPPSRSAPAAALPEEPESPSSASQPKVASIFK